MDILKDFDVPRGFTRMTGRVTESGSVTATGTASINGSTYFFWHSGRVVDGKIRFDPFAGRWETWTGRSVRGKVNVRLEELSEVAVDVIKEWQPDMSVFAPNVELSGAEPLFGEASVPPQG